MLSKSVLIGVMLLSMMSCTSKKTGYVDIFRLVKEFELQNEYSALAKKDMDMERAMIDSMVYLERLKNPDGFESLKSELYLELYKKTEQKNKEIESMIWKRLNPYLEDFGKEKGYQYIYGANGTGNVLYADKEQDITDEVIKYVNNRYHDKK